MSTKLSPRKTHTRIPDLVSWLRLPARCSAGSTFPSSRPAQSGYPAHSECSPLPMCSKTSLTRLGELQEETDTSAICCPMFGEFGRNLTSKKEPRLPFQLPSNWFGAKGYLPAALKSRGFAKSDHSKPDSHSSGDPAIKA